MCADGCSSVARRPPSAADVQEKKSGPRRLAAQGRCCWELLCAFSTAARKAFFNIANELRECKRRRAARANLRFCTCDYVLRVGKSSGLECLGKFSGVKSRLVSQFIVYNQVLGSKSRIKSMLAGIKELIVLALLKMFQLAAGTLTR